MKLRANTPHTMTQASMGTINVFLDSGLWILYNISERSPHEKSYMSGGNSATIIVFHTGADGVGYFRTAVSMQTKGKMCVTKLKKSQILRGFFPQLHEIRVPTTAVPNAIENAASVVTDGIDELCVVMCSTVARIEIQNEYVVK